MRGKGKKRDEGECFYMLQAQWLAWESANGQHGREREWGRRSGVAAPAALHTGKKTSREKKKRGATKTPSLPHSMGRGLSQRRRANNVIKARVVR